MSVSRRQFFKLAAAAGAVAIVPLRVVEALAPQTPAATPVGRALWRFQQIEHRSGYGMSELRLSLYRGSWFIDLTLALKGEIPHFDIHDEIELDIALEESSRLRLMVDGKPLQGVRDLQIRRELPMIEITSIFHDTSRQFAPMRPGDDDGLDDLTITKQWKYRKL